jgi:hypothetical protein
VSFTNFDVTHGDKDYTPVTAEITDDFVEIKGPILPGFTPPNGISYHAAPPELFGLTGEPVAPFAKIPFI